MLLRGFPRTQVTFQGQDKVKGLYWGRLMEGNSNLGILVSYPRDPSCHLLCPVSTGDGLRSA